MLNQFLKKRNHCDKCDYSCAQKSKMNKHVVPAHEGEKPFGWTKHVVSVHSFDCDICDYSFAQKSKMNKHVVPAHEGEKPFRCEQICCISSLI